MNEHEEFSKFSELMAGSSLYETIRDNAYACGGTNISLFNTYHYSVYVPTNESIEELQRTGKLPTWEAVSAATEAGDLTGATRDSLAIESFLRYHIQDNALFIDAAPESGDFETALIDPSTKRFYRISASSEGNQIVLYDNAKSEEPSRVVTTEVNGKKLYNLMAREYMYNNKDASLANGIETTSSAVVHLIDKPLFYKK